MTNIVMGVGVLSIAAIIGAVLVAIGIAIGWVFYTITDNLQ